MDVSKWFRPVACIIIYRIIGFDTEFLLGKRREGEIGGGKWGLVGGSGAFWEGAEDLFDFARREVVYDLQIGVDSKELKYLLAQVKRNGENLTLELYFSYKLAVEQEVKVTDNPRAPDDCRWFSVKDIREMAGRGEIAFDNDKILKAFSYPYPQHK